MKAIKERKQTDDLETSSPLHKAFDMLLAFKAESKEEEQRNSKI